MIAVRARAPRSGRGSSARGRCSTTCGTRSAPATCAACSRRLRDIDLVHAPSLAVPPRSGARSSSPSTTPRRSSSPTRTRGAGAGSTSAAFAAAAKRADVVIAPTNAAADEVAECTPIPRDRIRVVPHGVVQREVGDGLVASTRSTLGVGDRPVRAVGRDARAAQERRRARRGVPAAGRARPDLPHRLVIVGPKGWLDTADAVREPAARARRPHPLHRPGPRRPARSRSTAARTSSRSRACTRASGCRCSRRCRRRPPVLCSDIPVLHEVARRRGPLRARRATSTRGRRARRRCSATTPRAPRSAPPGAPTPSDFTWDRCAARTRALYREVLDPVTPPRLLRYSLSGSETAQQSREAGVTSRGRPTPGGGGAPSPTVVSRPWPGRTSRSAGSVKSRRSIDSRISGKSPSGSWCCPGRRGTACRR